MTPDPTVTAVSDESLRIWVAVGNPDVQSMAAELLRARSALADVGGASYNWGTPPFPNYPAETVDSMAEIGEAFMDALPKDYSWLQSPSEIIADLENQLHDAKQPRPAAEECACGVGATDPWKHDRSCPLATVSPAAHTAQVTARLSSAPWRVVKGKENVGHGWPVAFMGCDHNGDNWYIETHGVHASEAVSEPENDAKAIVAWRNSLAEQGSGAKEYKEGDK